MGFTLAETLTWMHADGAHQGEASSKVYSPRRFVRYTEAGGLPVLLLRFAPKVRAVSIRWTSLSCVVCEEPLDRAVKHNSSVGARVPSFNTPRFAMPIAPNFWDHRYLKNL